MFYLTINLWTASIFVCLDVVLSDDCRIVSTNIVSVVHVVEILCITVIGLSVFYISAVANAAFHMNLAAVGFPLGLLLLGLS
jgi:hypothetical protein